MNYEIKKTLIKIAKYGLMFTIPFLLTEYPDVYNMSIGGALVLVYDYLRHGKGVRLP